MAVDTKTVPVVAESALKKFLAGGASPDLIINPADGKPIDEELLALAFADEIKQAQAKYDLLCSQTIVSRMKAGSDAMVALWARNKFGWDRPGRTMTISVPNENGDIGDENTIIIELVKAPKRKIEERWGAPDRVETAGNPPRRRSEQ